MVEFGTTEYSSYIAALERADECLTEIIMTMHDPNYKVMFPSDPFETLLSVRAALGRGTSDLKDAAEVVNLEQAEI